MKFENDKNLNIPFNNPNDFELYEEMLEKERRSKRTDSKIMIIMIIVFALSVAIMFGMAICL